MKKIFSCLLVNLLLFSLGIPVLTAAPQSGRGRTPTPRPPDKPPQTPAAKRAAVPDGGRIVKQEGDGITSRFSLKNGLTVIVHEAHALPLVSVVTYVKAGGLQEGEGTGGVAQLVRHLVLKGSKPWPATVAAETRALGGVFASTTNYDSTIFASTVPAKQTESAVALQAEALLRPTFAPEDVKKEALLVIQAAHEQSDQATAYARDRLQQTAFEHRLSRWPFGAEEGLKNITPEQLQTFYNSHYQPNNVVVSIAGAVRTSTIMPTIQQHFGALATGSASNSPELPAQAAFRYANERGDLAHTLVNIGYRVPDLRSPEAPALQVLAALLGQGRGAKLYRSLRDGSGLATDVSAHYLGLAKVGYLSVQLRIAPEKIDDAEAAYFNDIEKFRRELVSASELQRAQTLIEKELADAFAPVEGKAQMLAQAQAVFGDHKRAFTHLKRIQAVTAEEVQKVAAKYLTLANTTVYEYEPKRAAPRTFPSAEAYAETVKFWAPRSQQLAVNAADVRPSEGLPTVKQGVEKAAATSGFVVELMPQPLKSFVTLHGPRVYVREDHSQPKVALGLFFEGGRLIEAANEHGLTELMLRAMLRGSKGEANPVVKLEQLGGQLEVINEPDFFGFTVQVLSRNAPAALQLLIDLIERPVFDKTMLPRERENQLALLRAEADDNLTRATQLFWNSLYPNHPYGRSRFGAEAVLRAATEDTLKEWHSKTIQKQYPLAIIVGDTDGSELVGGYLTEGFIRRDLAKSLIAPLPVLAAPAKEVVEERDRKQTAQVIGFAGPKGESNDHYALAMLESLTSNMGGRFFNELHNRQGLASTVLTFNQPYSLAGAFATYVTSAPEQAATARIELLQEFQKLATQELSDQELAIAENAAVGRYTIALQQHPCHVLEYARTIFLKRPVEHVDNLAEQVQAITKGDLKRVAAAYFKASQLGAGVIR